MGLLLMPPNIIPILLLHSFNVHLKSTITNAIHALGVEIEYIPAGCTILVQPVDVGFNKPFKSNIMKIYTSFMMAQDAYQPLCGAICLKVSG
jgi:hypothetical protein